MSTTESTTVGRDTAVIVANQRYWHGVADGLAQALRLLDAGLTDPTGQIRADMERAERNAAKAVSES